MIYSGDPEPVEKVLLWFGCAASLALGGAVVLAMAARAGAL